MTFAIVGFLGSIASLVALFLGATGWKAKLIHGIYAAAILVLSVLAYRQETRLSEIRNIESAALRLTKSSEGLTEDGAILAIMAFLEKTRYEFPDTYERAKAIYEKNDIATSSNRLSGSTGVSGLQHEWTKVDVAYALRGLLRGIAESSK
jgi:hypothetical protein